MSWIGRIRKSKFQKNVIAVVVASIVYHIWGTRNDVCRNNKVQTVDISANRIQGVVINRVYGTLSQN